MNEKKTEKYLMNAELKFQEEQLQAAQAAEALDKAMAVIEEFKAELTIEQYAEALGRFEEQREEIAAFVLKARDKYAAKLKELGDPTIDLREDV